MRYIYSLAEVPVNQLKFAGGKGKSLALMIQNLKVNVPYGYILTSEAIVNGILRPEAEKELEKLILKLDRQSTFAVRSSAINEDGDSASFAGQYETKTNVKPSEIMAAVYEVIASAENSRVKEYTDSFGEENRGIAVVIQLFVNPKFAGVIFTSDIITGSSAYMVGNYVHGEGENLVSGAANAEDFRMNARSYSYEGNDEFRPYAKRLFKYCNAIKKYYGMPMDIEWAVADGKVFILQARPITTLKRIDLSTYLVNGSVSDNKLLTRTNVGEIFMKPVSPMTFSMLELINDFLALPDWLDNIYGQPYMNISVMVSLLVSFKMSEEKAFEAISELAGNIPEDVRIPLVYFDRKAFISNLRRLIFTKDKSKLSKTKKHEIVNNLVEIARDRVLEIKGLNSNRELNDYLNSELIPMLRDGLSAIATECGTQMVPLFMAKKRIAKVAGEEMAGRLCGGSLGVIDCMKPLMLIEDVVSGKLSKEEYVRLCGHRCVNEMELMEPRPYENSTYPDQLIEEYRANNVSVSKMQSVEREKFDEALAEFKKLYPSRQKWIDKQIDGFKKANEFRESIRSKGVWILCVFREFALRVGAVNNIGDDVFMLTLSEMADLVQTGKSQAKVISDRKSQYNKYLDYPQFPAVILGRFNPDIWLKDECRRSDFYCLDYDGANIEFDDSTVKGFAGASGSVEGIVRVVPDISNIDEIQKGEILVTTATNIGWTLVFPKVAAIVTDIGAPLSHAAIVAREFGIPAVVGCSNATTVLKTGDRVIVDGSKGLVKKK